MLVSEWSAVLWQLISGIGHYTDIGCLLLLANGQRPVAWPICVVTLADVPVLVMVFSRDVANTDWRRGGHCCRRAFGGVKIATRLTRRLCEVISSSGGDIFVIPMSARKHYTLSLSLSLSLSALFHHFRLLIEVSICFCPTPEPLLVVQSTSLLPYLHLHRPSISLVVFLDFCSHWYSCSVMLLLAAVRFPFLIHARTNLVFALLLPTVSWHNTLLK